MDIAGRERKILATMQSLVLSQRTFSITLHRKAMTFELLD